MKENIISHLQKREIQAPVVTKIIAGFIKELGEEKTYDILSGVIEKDAIESGCILAKEFGGNSMHILAEVIRKVWCEDGAMEIDVLKEDSNKFHFNVTKCRYADIYRELGVPELGKYLSCNRDFPFNKGFNPDITLERKYTIMEGADHCDFRYYHRQY